MFTEKTRPTNEFIMLNLLLEVKPQNTKYGWKSEFFKKKKERKKVQNGKIVQKLNIILVTNTMGFVFLC